MPYVFANPYLDAVRALPPFPLAGNIHSFEARSTLRRQYAWAIPNDEALNTLAEQGRIVEMGAGKGYWAWCLRQAGVEVHAYDGFERGGYGYTQKGTWTAVLPGDPEMLRSYDSGWALLLIRPPADTSFASDCLHAFGGDVVAYVGGSPDWGVTGNPEFHQGLSKWTLWRRVEIPQWPGAQDAFWLFSRD